MGGEHFGSRRCENGGAPGAKQAHVAHVAHVAQIAHVMAAVWRGYERTDRLEPSGMGMRW